jgi:hypothetical protein
MSNKEGETPNQQTVVESNGVAKPTPETENARAPDWDELLSEYEQATSSSQQVEQPTATTVNGADDPLRTWAAQKMEEEKREREKALVEQTNKDIEKAVSVVLEGLDVPIKDQDLTEGYLHVLARKDERFVNAFNNRHKNPAGWNRVLKGVQSQLREKLNIDVQATQDREAVAAAVRSASNSAPEPKEEFNEKAVRRMSIGELTQKYPELNKNF